MRLRDWVRLASQQIDEALEADKLPGGPGDDKPDEDFDATELARGIKVEREHTTSDDLAKEIAKDHLSEDPAYYQKLQKIEPKHVRGRTRVLVVYDDAWETDAAKDPKIDAIRKDIESMDRAIDQLKRREEALTENLKPEQSNQAEIIRDSIQRRIDAINEDKQELQTQLQEMIMQKCGRPGKPKK